MPLLIAVYVIQFLVALSFSYPGRLILNIVVGILLKSLIPIVANGVNVKYRSERTIFPGKSVFSIIDTRMVFISLILPYYPDLLSIPAHTLNVAFRYFTLNIFRVLYVIVPADKAANNAIII